MRLADDGVAFLPCSKVQVQNKTKELSEYIYWDKVSLASGNLIFVNVVFVRSHCQLMFKSCPVYEMN